MLFSTYPFIFAFLPVAYFGYRLVRYLGFNASIVWLNLASLGFYAYWKVELLALLLGTITFNYVLSSRIGPDKPGSRGWMTFGVIANLSLLGFFKYTNFFLASVGALAGWRADVVSIVLPLGISFFTFQQISYIVDMHRERFERPPFFKYLLCITFFPHLIAGPLLHFRDILSQVRAPVTGVELRELGGEGLAFFAIGLFKKLVLADPAGVIADQAFNSVAAGGEIGAARAALGLFAYTVEIYLDFSGYSDMAIGLALLFGIRLPQNFDRPYLSLSIVDFWRRWHMSLSRFLRNYLYIQLLGGNRKGEARRNVNLMLTMLLGGLWHGAGWNFVVWGGLHGVYLLVNHSCARRFPSLRIPGWLSWAITLAAVMLAWVFFRAQSFEHAFDYLRQFAFLRDGAGRQAWLVVGLGAAWIGGERWIYGMRQNWARAGLAAVLAFTAVLFMGDETPFIYFNF